MNLHSAQVVAYPSFDIGILDPEKCFIYRRWDRIDAALKGHGDIDLFVFPEHFAQIRNSLVGHNAIMGVLSRYHDNNVPYREEWFVPVLNRDGPVHLDMISGLCIGPRFSKLLSLPYNCGSDLAWHDMPGGKRIRVAGDELLVTQIAARSAFSARGLLPFGQFTINYKGQLPSSMDVLGNTVTLEPGPQGFRIFFNSLSGIRKLLLEKNGYSGAKVLGLWVRHFRRSVLYGCARVLEASGAATVPKRRPASGGAVIALVGPDGVGKSTQAHRLRHYFSGKFSTKFRYMGHSGHLSRVAHSLRRKQGVVPSSQSSPKNAARTKRHLEDATRCMWGMWLAIYRLLSAKRSRRLAKKGYLVFADRWPQHIERGLMDGAVRRVTEKTFWPIERLFSVEEAIYKRLDELQPDLIFHLTVPYAVAEARKPGELKAKEFEDRIDLMRRCREGKNHVRVIDASVSAKDVFAVLLTGVWDLLFQRQQDVQVESVLDQ